jgi:hypothetical protein
MKINKVRLEIREFVLCATVSSKLKSVDFNSLGSKEKLRELKTSTPKKILHLFKNLKVKDSEIVNAMLARCPAIIEHIKRPTVTQLKRVLDTHPHALNKIASNKRTESLIIQAIRPEKRYLFGSRDERARETVKNVSALHPNTSFTPRVYHEVVRLMAGAPEKTIKKLISTFEKQKKKIPDELRRMVSRIKSKALSSCSEEYEEIPLVDTEGSIEESMDKTKSIVRITQRPYSITVCYPDSPEYRYDYYIGDNVLYNKALSLQFNPGEFSKYVKKQDFPVKKYKAQMEFA